MKKQNPVDVFLDTYLPHATEAKREDAVENLKSFVRVLTLIDEAATRRGENSEAS